MFRDKGLPRPLVIWQSGSSWRLTCYEGGSLAITFIMATCSVKRKLVFVEVEKAANDTMSYEVEFETKSGDTDVGSVINILRKKSRYLESELQPGRFSVKVKSTNRPDKLINKGDYTPLKNNSDLFITLSGENYPAIERMEIDAEQSSSEAEKGIDIFYCPN